MIATAWPSCARSEAVEAFERACGPRGDSARRFARIEDYGGTELLKFDGRPVRYPTIDCSRGRQHFEPAKTPLPEEYAELDRRCDAYTSEETWLGLHTVFE